jgi:SAM-dependent methyltransferase
VIGDEAPDRKPLSAITTVSCLLCSAPCDTVIASLHCGALSCQVYRCANCELQFVAPQPTSEQLAEFYRSGYRERFGYGQPRLERAIRGAKRRNARRLLKSVEHARPPGRLLELGCGAGEFLDEAAQSGWTAVGVDPNPQSPSVIRGTAESVDFAPCSFDAIFCLDSFEHFTDPARVVAQMANWLMPGGCVTITTPNAGELSARMLGRRWPHYHFDHLWYFSARSLKLLFGSSDWERPSVSACWKDFCAGYMLQILSDADNPFPLKPLWRGLLQAFPSAALAAKLPPIPHGLQFTAYRSSR